MLYDTRQTPDTSLPGNAKLGWSAENNHCNLSLPVRGCDAAGFAPGDLLCVRQVSEGIKIWRAIQQRAPGRSTLKADPRASGEGFYYVSTTILEFKVPSFARCGVSVWVPKWGEMFLSPPQKENMTAPKAKAERKLSFTFDEAVEFFGSSCSDELRATRVSDPEVWEAAVRGLQRA